MVSSIFYNGDGSTRIFPVSFKILGDDYVRVYVNDVEVVDKTKYDIINNSIVFITSETPAVGTDNVKIYVATSVSELGDLGAPLYDITNVANNIQEIIDVSESLDTIEAVNDNKANINLVGANTADINTVANDISNVNTVAEWANVGFPIVETGNAFVVETVEELSSIPAGYKVAIVSDLSRGGTFEWSATGTANGGTVFAGVSGYWNRQYSGAVNVTWFGAIADGSQNCHININNALVYLAKSGGGTLFVPKGEYLLGGIIRIGSNTTLHSEPGVIYRKNHTASFLHNSLSNSGVVYTTSDNIPSYQGTHNITIRGGVWAGFSEGIYEGYTHFALGFATNIKVEDVTLLDGITGGHFIDLCACKDVSFTNVKMLGQSLLGGTISDTQEMVQLDHNVYGSFPGVYFGVPTFDQNKNISFFNCEFGSNPDNEDPRFSGPVTAIGSHGSVHNEWHENITIKDCTFNGVRFAAIREWKWKNLNVVGCKFNNGTTGIHCTATSEGSVSSQDRNRVQSNKAQHGKNKKISRCTFTNLSNVGIFSSDVTLSTDITTRHEDVDVSGCEFIDCNEGIRARQVRSFKVRGCEFINSIGTRVVSFYDNSEDVIIDSNIVNGGGGFNDGTGLYFTACSGGVVTGNSLSNFDSRAILLTGGSSGFVISNNRISGWGQVLSVASIVAQSGANNITISNNNIYSPSASFTGNNYIHATGTAVNVDILDNKFDNKTKLVENQSVGGISRIVYTGNPEGVVVSGKGSIVNRIDGGAGSTLYVKESGTGATGWVAK